MASHQYHQGPNPRTGDGIRGSACVYEPAERHLHGARLDPQVRGRNDQQCGTEVFATATTRLPLC
jgi:hypothetical protein